MQRQNNVFEFDDISFRSVFDLGNQLSLKQAQFIMDLYADNQELFHDGYFDRSNLATSIFKGLVDIGEWGWAVYKEEDPQGLIVIDNWYMPENQPYSCILHIFFLKNIKATKTALKSGKFILDLLLRMGVKRITTTIDKENTAGIKFYKKLGFEIEGLHKARVLLNGEPRDEYTLAFVA